MVEENIVTLLRQRAIDCVNYEGYDESVLNSGTKCEELKVISTALAF